MFCDLVGSTELAARLDPDDLREVIGAYHRALRTRHTVSREAIFRTTPGARPRHFG
jgi:class 3 adenylate cyclase